MAANNEKMWDKVTENNKRLHDRIAANPFWKKWGAKQKSKASEAVRRAAAAGTPPPAAGKPPTGTGAAGNDARPRSVADDPAVGALLERLQGRVDSLRDVAPERPCLHSSLHSAQGMVRPGADAAAAVTSVDVNPAQREALCGLSGDVRDLIAAVDARLAAAAEARGPRGDGDGDGNKSEDQRKDRQNTSRQAQRVRAVTNLKDAVDKGGSLLNELANGTMSERAISNIFGGVEIEEKEAKKKTFKDLTQSLIHANRVARMFSEGRQSTEMDQTELEYVPREFGRLGEEQRRQLAKLLSWEGLDSWGFDAFQVERLSRVSRYRRQSTLQQSIVRLDHFSELDASETTREEQTESEAFWEALSDHEHAADDAPQDTAQYGYPLVLIGWAVLSSPYAQLAMARNVRDPELEATALKALRRRTRLAKSGMARKMVAPPSEAILEDQEAPEADNWDPDPGGYFFPDEFEVSSRAVCRVLRKAEGEYSPVAVNPYHSNIHAADVIQATHALLRWGEPDMSLAYTPLERYAILLAASLHDIRHPGTNNNYQMNAETELTMTYNDQAVLENMHASRACFLLAADLKGAREKKTTGIYGDMTKEQRRTFRTTVIRLILSTDMAKHFSNMGELTGYVEALEEDALERGKEKEHLLELLGEDKHAKLREEFLCFVLHMADLNNPARPEPVSAAWSECVYQEFFLQGDREKEEGLPVSPLCDRAETCPYESQVGFMKFVVKPAFKLLARVLPRTEEIALTCLEENFQYWEKKIKAKVQNGEES